MAASGPLHLQFPLSGKFFLRYAPSSFSPFTQVSLLMSPSQRSPSCPPSPSFILLHNIRFLGHYLLIC